MNPSTITEYKLSLLNSRRPSGTLSVGLAVVGSELDGDAVVGLIVVGLKLDNAIVG